MNPKPKLPNYEFLRFQQAISPKRLETYRNSLSDRNSDLLSTYLWNISLSEALYPVLHNFEIALRNSLYQAISRSFYEDWLCRVDSEILHDNEVKAVRSAIKSLCEKGRSISTGNLVSELNLGFWVSLSYSKYEARDRLYPRLFKDKEFLPHIPKSRRTRRTLSEQFTLIKKLRNRVFHHDPIWNESNLRRTYDNTLEVIQWISPMLYETTKNLSRFPDVYVQGRTIYTEIVEKTISGAESDCIKQVSQN